ncbi:MAG: DUF1127 domain-containing protein [Pseudomonadota bacterium]
MSGLQNLGRRRAVLRHVRLGNLLRRVLKWSARRRQRVHLAQLDDAALRDIGLTRHDVQREIERPFWY